MTALLRLSGLIVAPAAWLVGMQLGQLLPYGDCMTERSWSLLAALATSVAAAGGAAVSLITLRGAQGTDRFLSAMSGCAGFAFVFALLMQTIATMAVDPCAR